MIENAPVVASTAPPLKLPFTLLTYFHLIYVSVCKKCSNQTDIIASVKVAFVRVLKKPGQSQAAHSAPIKCQSNY